MVALRFPFSMSRKTSYAFSVRFMLLITGMTRAKRFPLL